MAVLATNTGGPVNADSGEIEVPVVVTASCGTALLFGVPSTVMVGALFVMKSAGATGAQAQMRY